MTEVGFDRYLALMADWASLVLDPLIKKKKTADDVPESERRLFDDIFRRCVDVRDTYDNLDLCLAYIKAPMPRRKGFKVDQVLMYHLTFYFQEIYILSERLEAYITRIAKLKAKRGDSEAIKREKRLVKIVRGSLSGIVKTRGSHVHERPFSTPELDALSRLSFIASLKPEFSEDLPLEYRLVRDDWVRTLKGNKTALHDLMNLIFDEMFEEVTHRQPLLIDLKQLGKNWEKN
jgi:hypothetical protein